ncbi:hypothetical protein B0H15DRAFT_796053 [Mycena belliarum]|uniref:DOT1 domain-containing protein n=1 Tax=Mycena belliarum TaxID=1033014 RepID=A0AAD6XZ14_9AGAR|nr:hypothetical protein B0H15DRAFT_796053 [Mycena belliae]
MDSENMSAAVILARCAASGPRRCYGDDVVLGRRTVGDRAGDAAENVGAAAGVAADSGSVLLPPLSGPRLPGLAHDERFASSRLISRWEWTREASVASYMSMIVRHGMGMGLEFGLVRKASCAMTLGIPMASDGAPEARSPRSRRRRTALMRWPRGVRLEKRTRSGAGISALPSARGPRDGADRERRGGRERMMRASVLWSAPRAQIDTDARPVCISSARALPPPPSALERMRTRWGGDLSARRVRAPPVPNAAGLERGVAAARRSRESRAAGDARFCTAGSGDRRCREGGRRTRRPREEGRPSHYPVVYSRVMLRVFARPAGAAGGAPGGAPKGAPGDVLPSEVFLLCTRRGENVAYPRDEGAWGVLRGLRGVRKVAGGGRRRGKSAFCVLTHQRGMARSGHDGRWKQTRYGEEEVEMIGRERKGSHNAYGVWRLDLTGWKWRGYTSLEDTISQHLQASLYRSQEERIVLGIGKKKKELLKQEKPENVIAVIADAPFSTTAECLLFLDLLYDSTVSPNITFVKGQKGSWVYGELESEALQTLCRCVRQSLKQGSLFLDIGVGIGHTALFVMLTTSCNTIAYKFMEAPAKLAHYWSISRSCLTDTSQLCENTISAASVILWKNKAFEPDNARQVDVINVCLENWGTFMGICSWSDGVVVHDLKFHREKPTHSTTTAFWSDQAGLAEWYPTNPPCPYSYIVASRYCEELRTPV